MAALFGRVPGKIEIASPGHLEELQRVYQAEHRNGLIEIQSPDGRQVVLLYLDGQMVGAYRLEQNGSIPVIAESVRQEFGEKDTTFRMVDLPSQAVRMAGQVLEWAPAARQDQADAQAFKAYLATCVREKRTGLLQVVFPTLEAYIWLQQGSPIPAETLTWHAGKFEAEAPQPTQIPAGPGNLGELYWYQPLAENECYVQFLVRLGVSAWVKGFLSRYQQIAGTNILLDMNYALNRAMRMQRLNFQFVGTEFTDRHMFLSREAEFQAYSNVLLTMTDLAAKIIGVPLSKKILSATFNALGTDDRCLLETYQLSPSIADNK